MVSWSEVTEAAPALATAIRARIEGPGLALLATLRRDGAPRISGVEPFFFRDDLWIGMMLDSRKGADLRRDPRLALHNATIDKEVTDGDVKVGGRGVLVEGEEKRGYARAFKEDVGHFPEGDFDLFRVDVIEITMLRPDGDHLAIDSWRVGEPVKRVERR